MSCLSLSLSPRRERLKSAHCGYRIDCSFLPFFHLPFLPHLLLWLLIHFLFRSCRPSLDSTQPLDCIPAPSNSSLRERKEEEKNTQQHNSKPTRACQRVAADKTPGWFSALERDTILNAASQNTPSLLLCCLLLLLLHKTNQAGPIPNGSAPQSLSQPLAPLALPGPVYNYHQKT